MKRRNFISAAGLAGLGLTFSSFNSDTERKKTKNIRGTFSTTDNRVSIYTNAQVKPARIFHITDTHLSLDDERGVKYKQFSKRMAGAYKSNTHFQTEEKYSTKESFENTLQLAKEQDIDFLALTGDIFSFPSEAAVDWVFQKLNDTGIPFAYVAGNHDWHYEGMKGSRQQLRKTWTEKHLKPMYQNNNPLYAAYDFNGVRYICIDNSTYEILPEQLDFFKAQAKSDTPIVLLMHIPLFMPGRSMGFGCANPNWGAKSDKNFKLERREQWRKGGHTKTTINFYEKVFNAPNLLTVLAGHTHHQSLDIKNGIPQIVSGHNATGYYSDIQIDSLP
ncbi:MAG: metallophosphoesterase [Bacteroidetes bacterium]|nr:metallophosphoesterase [Bacteroidota bacterium]